MRPSNQSRNQVKVFPVLATLIVLAVAGCGGPKVGDPVQLRATSEPQSALFYVRPGWTGGCGEAVLDSQGDLVRLDQTPVFLNRAAFEQVMKAAGNPTCFQGGESILVSARVKLVDDHCSRTLPAPGGGISQDRMDYLRLDIVELQNVIAELTPCETP